MSILSNITINNTWNLYPVLFNAKRFCSYWVDSFGMMRMRLYYKGNCNHSRVLQKFLLHMIHTIIQIPNRVDLFGKYFHLKAPTHLSILVIQTVFLKYPRERCLTIGISWSGHTILQNNIWLGSTQFRGPK